MDSTPVDTYRHKIVSVRANHWLPTAYTQDTITCDYHDSTVAVESLSSWVLYAVHIYTQLNNLIFDNKSVTIENLPLIVCLI